MLRRHSSPGGVDAASSPFASGMTSNPCSDQWPRASGGFTPSTLRRPCRTIFAERMLRGDGACRSSNSLNRNWMASALGVSA